MWGFAVAFSLVFFSTVLCSLSTTRSSDVNVHTISISHDAEQCVLICKTKTTMKETLLHPLKKCFRIFRIGLVLIRKLLNVFKLQVRWKCSRWSNQPPPTHTYTFKDFFLLSFCWCGLVRTQKNKHSLTVTWLETQHMLSFVYGSKNE